MCCTNYLKAETDMVRGQNIQPTDGTTEPPYEHYQCHKIYVKKMRSVKISDTVFFKHKHITQPTLTQADTIVKVIDDLTQALKGRNNLKGTAQIEASEKMTKSSTTCQKQRR
jgi:hypothetical protein